MKKSLIGLTILFSFLFISNVSASSDRIEIKNYTPNSEDLIFQMYYTGDNYYVYYENDNNRLVQYNTYYKTNFILDTTDKYVYMHCERKTYSPCYFVLSDEPLKLNSDNYIVANTNTYSYDFNFNEKTYYNSGTILPNTYSFGIINKKDYYTFVNFDLYNNNNEMIVKQNFDLSKEPELKYKTGFVSSDAYSVLGKVSNNFKFVDNNFVTEYKNYKFKLQFGSNDFTEENIPVFSHFKLYGRYNESDTWHSMDKYFEGNYVSLDILDTTYDYSEGMLADASITLQLNFNYTEELFNILYDEFKIEFYLDNTQNGYIYCYDNLTSSEWEDTSKFLEDYIYYYFPSNYKYAFITSENNINEGKIYFPTNSLNNELVKLQGQYYNLKNKSYSNSIITNLYLNDTYYSYFDFYFNDNDRILLLNRAVGSYTYTSYYNVNFLEFWSNIINETLGDSILDSYSISEDTYFYVPIGYKVYFTNDINITVNTSNGNIDIDIENSNNDYESDIEMEETTSNSFFILFHKAFNYFISPISSFLSLITSFFEVLPLGIQYSFYVAFGFMIALLIYKFIL